MKLIGAFFMLPAIVLAIVVGGLCGSILWGWFIVPLGVPDIGIAHAIGISTLFSFWMGDVKRDSGEVGNEPSLVKFWTALAAGLIRSGFLLFVGWLVKLCM